MEKAIFELNDKLKHPSDIEQRLDTMLMRYRDENAEQQEKKQKEWAAEINSTKGSLTNLKEIQEAIRCLKVCKKQCESTLKSNKYAINEYKIIKQLATAYQNFVKSKYFLERMTVGEEDINEEDLEKYAEKIYENDEVICDMKMYNYGLNVEEGKVVERKLNQLKKLSLEFTSAFLHVATDASENTHLFEKIERIIQKEEERDDIVRKVKLGISGEDLVARQYYLENLKYINFEVKDFQNRFISAIKTGIKDKFDKLKDEVDFLAKLDFIFEDLQKFSKRSLCFFTFEDFISEYHSALKALYDQKIKVIGSENVLSLIEFKAQYYKAIQEMFKKVPESLGPRLIENEAELLHKYSEVASAKLKEWIDNITMMEINKFMTRESEITKDESEKPISTGFINLLQIIKAQLEPISFNKKIFLQLTAVIKERCIVFKENLRKTLQSELQNIYEWKGLHGFEDYCIIFGNSGLRLTQYISTLSFFQTDEVRELQQIFLGILKNSNVILCNHVIFTCKPALSKLFTDDWEKKNQRRVFAITLEDFLNDYRNTMSDYMFTTFIGELCTKIYEIYKKDLQSQKLVITANTSESMKKDVEKLTTLFKKYVNEDEFSECLKNILKLCPLIEAISGDLFIIEAKSLILANPEISKTFIEAILQQKSDMNGNEKNVALSELPTMFSEGKKKKTLVSKLLKK